MKFNRVARVVTQSYIAPLVPFGVVRPFLRSKLTSVFGHNICDQPTPFTRHLYRHPNVSAFEQMLDVLSENFTFVSLADAWAHARGTRHLPPNSLFLSFDDGFREIIEVVAPILERRNIPAAFFVTTSAVDNQVLFWGHKKSYLVAVLEGEIDEKIPDALLPELATLLGLEIQSTRSSVRWAIQKLYIHDADARRTIDLIADACDIAWEQVLRRHAPYLSTEQLRELHQRGFALGSHGIDHLKFAWLSDEERHRQIEGSLRFLRETVGIKKITFSFPNSASKVSDKWMIDAIASHDNLEGFMGTGRYKTNAPHIINRITMDFPVASNNDEPILKRIKTELIKHLVL